MEAEEQEMSPVTDACHQLSEGLFALSARDSVPPTTSSPTTVMAPAATSVTFSAAQSVPPFVGSPAMPAAASTGGIYPGQVAPRVGVVPAQPMSTAVGSPFIVQHQQPVNPVILAHPGLHFYLFE